MMLVHYSFYYWVLYSLLNNKQTEDDEGEIFLILSVSNQDHDFTPELNQGSVADEISNFG